MQLYFAHGKDDIKAAGRSGVRQVQPLSNQFLKASRARNGSQLCMEAMSLLTNGAAFRSFTSRQCVS
jgi:hypothetical protein